MYTSQWMMLYGSFILIWIYGFSMYFYLGRKYKKLDEKQGGNK